MAESTVRRIKSFGAEHGLIHEVVVTGRKVGADEDFWKALAHDQKLFGEVVEHVSGRQTFKVRRGGQTRRTVAAEIFASKNMHGVDVVKQKLRIQLTASDYSWVPFSEQTLQSLSESHVLVAAPEISIADLIKKQEGLLAPCDGPMYSRSMDLSDEKFVDVKLAPGWYLVNKKPVTGSTHRKWETQQKQVLYPDAVIEANLALYALVLHSGWSDELYWGHHWQGIRTATRASNGQQVCLSREHGASGVVVSTDNYSDSKLGVGSYRLPT